MITLEVGPSAQPNVIVARVVRHETEPRAFRNPLAILLVPNEAEPHIRADIVAMQSMSREQQDAAAERLRALTAYPAPVFATPLPAALETQGLQGNIFDF